MAMTNIPEDKLQRYLAEWLEGEKKMLKKQREQELNRKLALFAEYTNLAEGEAGLVGLAPNDRGLRLLNYTQDLTACFRDIVPKLGNWVTIKFDIEYGQAFSYISVEEDGAASGQAETPALAFCLAVEKLIDGEPKKEV